MRHLQRGGRGKEEEDRRGGLHRDLASFVISYYKHKTVIAAKHDNVSDLQQVVRCRCSFLSLLPAPSVRIPLHPPPCPKPPGQKAFLSLLSLVMKNGHKKEQSPASPLPSLPTPLLTGEEEEEVIAGSMMYKLRRQLAHYLQIYATTRGPSAHQQISLHPSPGTVDV